MDVSKVDVPGKRYFFAHASFASRTDHRLLRLLQEKVEEAGGVFTGGHIADANSWKYVWGEKCKDADRVIVCLTEEYYKYYTPALEWEHGEIFKLADDFKLKFNVEVLTPVFFADESTLLDPTKLCDWLGKANFNDRRGFSTGPRK